MRSIKFLLLSVLLAAFLDAKSQESTPIEFKTTILNEVTNNFSGGISRGANFNGRIGVGMGMNTEKAGWWKGGYFYLQGFAVYSGTPTSSEIGDLQPISRIEASDRIGLFEFWYRHDLGPVQLSIGQLDMNALFGVNKLSGTFLNTSFGLYPSVALNTPLSIYPAATSAVMAKVKISKAITFQTALYDGNPLSFEDNPYNVKRDWDLLDEIFSTAEVSFTSRSESGTSGIYKAGMFYHNGTYISLVADENVQGSLGGYVSIQEYLKVNTNKRLGVFLQLGSAKGDGSIIDFYTSSGVSYQGLFNRKDDHFAMGFVHSSINNQVTILRPDLEFHRTLLEANYHLKINENFSVQPDIQYIINPGAKADLDNVLVGILRLTIQY